MTLSSWSPRLRGFETLREGAPTWARNAIAATRAGAAAAPGPVGVRGGVAPTQRPLLGAGGLAGELAVAALGLGFLSASAGGGMGMILICMLVVGLALALAVTRLVEWRWAASAHPGGELRPALALAPEGIALEQAGRLIAVPWSDVLEIVALPPRGLGRHGARAAFVVSPHRRSRPWIEVVPSRFGLTVWELLPEAERLHQQARRSQAGGPTATQAPYRCSGREELGARARDLADDVSALAVLDPATGSTQPILLPAGPDGAHDRDQRAHQQQAHHPEPQPRDQRQDRPQPAADHPGTLQPRLGLREHPRVHRLVGVGLHDGPETQPPELGKGPRHQPQHDQRDQRIQGCRRDRTHRREQQHPGRDPQRRSLPQPIAEEGARGVAHPGSNGDGTECHDLAHPLRRRLAHEEPSKQRQEPGQQPRRTAREQRGPHGFGDDEAQSPPQSGPDSGLPRPRRTRSGFEVCRVARLEVALLPRQVVVGAHVSVCRGQRLPRRLPVRIHHRRKGDRQDGRDDIGEEGHPQRPVGTDPPDQPGNRAAQGHPDEARDRKSRVGLDQGDALRHDPGDRGGGRHGIRAGCDEAHQGDGENPRRPTHDQPSEYPTEERAYREGGADRPAPPVAIAVEDWPDQRREENEGDHCRQEEERDLTASLPNRERQDRARERDRERGIGGGGDEMEFSQALSLIHISEPTRPY